MGKPSARLSDKQTCPVGAGTNWPHVGGIISTPGLPTVLIEKLIAARQGDTTACKWAPGTISAGSLTVRIGNKPAARMGDPTTHGGVITSGALTVFIGG